MACPQLHLPKPNEWRWQERERAQGVIGGAKNRTDVDIPIRMRHFVHWKGNEKPAIKLTSGKPPVASQPALRFQCGLESTRCYISLRGEIDADEIGSLSFVPDTILAIVCDLIWLDQTFIGLAWPRRRRVVLRKTCRIDSLVICHGGELVGSSKVETKIEV